MAFTLVNLREQKLLALWSPGGGRLMRRCFYYSLQWRQAREEIRGSRDRRVRWWDEDDPIQDDATPEAEGGDDALTDPSLDPSPRGHLDGFVETFVHGWPRNQLIRKAGFGMDPPFQRMRGARSGVVEMRTQATRTFGFFARQDVFVAHRLALADHTHADPSLYEKYGDDVLKLLARMEPSDKDVTSNVEDLIGD